jgi:CubicO group peptidase (beta-lactamase class C family)
VSAMGWKGKKRWIGALVGLGIAGGAVAAMGGRGPSDIPAGTGYAALELCSKTFQSGMPFAQVQERYAAPEVKPLPLVWEIAQGADTVEVRTRVPLLAHPRTALFRKGLGCTVITPDAELASVRAQSLTLAPEAALDPGAWPSGEGAAETELASDAMRKVIAQHAETIFGEASRSVAEQQNATALLLATGGKLVYERYAQGYGRENPELGWSMTKTVTTMIAGLLAADGKVRLDDPLGLPSWQGTPKAAITWRALLNMASGLAWQEAYEGTGDTTEMMFAHADQGAWAASLPLTSEPGKVFNYSTGASNIAMLRMRQLLGGNAQAIYDYYQTRLFAPLGIRHGVIEMDATGTPVGGARGLLRPVDWLRLGQLVANGGSWNGAQLLPPDYVAFMKQPSPASPEYAGTLWTASADMIAPELREKLPRDLVWFAGFTGQAVIVVPSHELVVLRMGTSFDEPVAWNQVFALVVDLTRG